MIWLIVRLLSASIAVVAGSEAVGRLIELETVDQFKKEIYNVKGEGSAVAVLFYSIECPFSRSILPKWREVSARMSAIKVAQFDAGTFAEFAISQGVVHYPTIRLYLQPQQWQEYPLNSERTWEAITNWLTSHLGVIVKLDNLQTVKDTRNCVVYLDTPKHNQLMKQVIENFTDQSLAFFKTESKSMLTEICGKAQLCVSVRDSETEGTRVAKWREGSQLGDGVPSEIVQFIKTRLFPLLTQFSGQTAEALFTVNMPLLIFFAPPQASDLKDTCEAMRSEILCVLCGKDSQSANSLRTQLGISSNNDQEFRIVRMTEPDYRILKYRPLQSTGSVAEFVADFRADKLKPYLRSAPIPDYYGGQRGGVIEVVGENFESEILNGREWAFVNFFASWCGHCRKLAPDWESMARQLSNGGKLNKGVIAKIDASVNEIPRLSVKSFPTLLLFKKAEIFEYRGERDVASFIAFLKEHRVDLSTSELSLSDQPGIVSNEL